MSELTLVIGNKHSSSWSLRPWLVLYQFEIPFEELLIPLDREDTAQAIREHSAAGWVPVLHHGDLTVWDSLAILEYLAEQFPDRAIWPRDPTSRALARCVSAEMHSGFQALRTAMPMNLRQALSGRGRTPEVLRDIERITAIWRECRERYQREGAFLFGEFSAADAMYAPVVTRFATYDVELDPVCRAYAETIMALPGMRTWYAEAQDESWMSDV